jgi:hypothetical protein
MATGRADRWRERRRHRVWCGERRARARRRSQRFGAERRRERRRYIVERRRHTRVRWGHAAHMSSARRIVRRHVRLLLHALRVRSVRGAGHLFRCKHTLLNAQRLLQRALRASAGQDHAHLSRRMQPCRCGVHTSERLLRARVQWRHVRWRRVSARGQRLHEQRSVLLPCVRCVARRQVRPGSRRCVPAHRRGLHVGRRPALLRNLQRQRQSM